MYILKVDEHGRIILPRELKDRFGGAINIEVDGDRIILKPVY